MNGKADAQIYTLIFTVLMFWLLLFFSSFKSCPCFSERIKVVFVPVVPDPSKSLQDLFKKYNGNVEVSISVMILY